jgi:LmbE family N-acetylglucosaminyl deacetylase
MHPYHRFVAETIRLHHEARGYPRGGFHPLPRPALPADAPRVLIFAPHPDDECVCGALPLRLLRQAEMKVIDVAVTLGSKADRQAERLEELTNACEFLGFELATTGPRGLAQINARTRAHDPMHWRTAVSVIAGLLDRHRPQVIFFPHATDGHSTHVGTHHLVMDALALQAPFFDCAVVETEFWSTMADPNLMVESTPDDVSDLVAATSCHAGEVERNPYHLILPGWMQDNVRRGSELVGGQGESAPDFLFATLYRVRRWHGGKLEAAPAGRVLSAKDDPSRLLLPGPA